MRYRYWAGLVVAMIGAASLPAPARAVANESEDGEICVAIARRWAGTPAEREKILENPVPASFRQIYNSTGCGRWQLIVESLLDWHLRYGNAQSARRAIEFLEKATGGQPDPKSTQTYIRHWQTALADIRSLIREAEAKAPGKGDEHQLQSLRRTIESLPAIVALQKDRNQLSGYHFLANEYTRAAEFFLSPELVEGAERFQTPTLALAGFLDRQPGLGVVEANLADLAGIQFYRGRLSATARQVSLAVTKAAMSRNAATIEAADAALRARYSDDGKLYPFPDLLTFINQAYEGGNDDDTCNPDELNSRPDYRERCEENGFEEEALSFWFQRSRLELLARKHGTDLSKLDIPFTRSGSTQKTIDLYRRRAWASGGIRYGEDKDETAPAVVQLLVWSADATVPTADCGDMPGDNGPELWQALNQLIWAQTLIHPAGDPRLYRQTAETYLRIHDVAIACGRELRSPVLDRAALMSRGFLAQYPQLLASD